MAAKERNRRPVRYNIHLTPMNIRLTKVLITWVLIFAAMIPVIYLSKDWHNSRFYTTLNYFSASYALKFTQ